MIRHDVADVNLMISPSSQGCVLVGRLSSSPAFKVVDFSRVWTSSLKQGHGAWSCVVYWVNGDQNSSGVCHLSDEGMVKPPDDVILPSLWISGIWSTGSVEDCAALRVHRHVMVGALGSCVL